MNPVLLMLFGSGLLLIVWHSAGETLIAEKGNFACLFSNVTYYIDRHKNTHYDVYGYTLNISINNDSCILLSPIVKYRQYFDICPDCAETPLDYVDCKSIWSFHCHEIKFDKICLKDTSSNPSFQ